jgi:hypothetical protein
MKTTSYLFLFLFFPFLGYSQIDSIDVNVKFERKTFKVEGEDSLTLKVIKAETWINDFDFFGEIIVTVYDEIGGYLVDKVKYTKQAVIDNNLYNSGVISTILYNGIDKHNYRIDVLVRDYQGMNFPIISKTLIE